MIYIILIIAAHYQICIPCKSFNTGYVIKVQKNWAKRTIRIMISIYSYKIKI